MSPIEYEHPAPEDITLVQIFSGLGDPIRIEMVKRLADGNEHDSNTLADDIPRTTLSYHTRKLRESGLTWTRREGKACMISLRKNDLHSRFPGLLEAITDNV